LIDDVNEEKFWSHSLTATQVLQVLERPFFVGRNRKHRAATHFLIGRDRGGRCIAMPINATAQPEIWRPHTAWLCTDQQEARLPPDD
jgi:hypothetical protein